MIRACYWTSLDVLGSPWKIFGWLPGPDSKCIVSLNSHLARITHKPRIPSDTPHPGTQLLGIRVQLKAVVTLS